MLAEFGASGGHKPLAVPLAPMPLEGPAPEPETPRWTEGRRVWRVRRDKGVSRAFLGMIVGTAPAALAMGHKQTELAFLLIGVFTALGWSIGKRQRWDYCSDPDCSADLAPSLLTCPKCGGTISGEISDPSKRPLDDDDDDGAGHAYPN